MMWNLAQDISQGVAFIITEYTYTIAGYNAHSHPQSKIVWISKIPFPSALGHILTPAQTQRKYIFYDHSSCGQ